MNNYEPEGPYILKSGRFKGKTLECLMFSHYKWIYQRWKEREELYTGKREKDKFHNHLNWLIGQGENRRTKVACPWCRKRWITLFSVLYEAPGSDFSINPAYTSCSQKECKQLLQSSSLTKEQDIYGFQFSVMALKKFEAKIDQKRIGDFFRWAFKLPKPLTKEKAFEFFKE